MYDIKRHMELTKRYMGQTKKIEHFLFFKPNSRFYFLLVNLSMPFLFGFLFYSTVNISFINKYFLLVYADVFSASFSFYYFLSYLLFFVFLYFFLFVFLGVFLFSLGNACFLIGLILKNVNYYNTDEDNKELKEIEENLTLQKYYKIASSSTVTSKELFFIKTKINSLKNDIYFIDSFKQRINKIKKENSDIFEKHYGYDVNKHKKICEEKKVMFNCFEFFLGLLLFNNLILFSISNNKIFENYSNIDSLFYLSIMFFSFFLFIFSSFLIVSNLKRFFSKSKIEKEMIKKDFNNINNNITISNIEDVINSNNIDDIKFIEPFLKPYEYNLKNNIEKSNCYEQNKKQKIKNKKEINII